jgi:plastocyanin
MKRKRLIKGAVIFVLMFCLPVFAYAAEEKAEEEIKIINKIVVLSASEGAKPVTVTSEIGTTVIWLNRSRHPIEILFLDKQVVLACGSPVNFIVGKGGAYESAKIPFGGTASLCFLEKGRFDYKINSSRTFYDREFLTGHRGSVVIK